MASSSLLLIQAGTPPEDIRAVTGDLPQWFLPAIGRPQTDIQVVRVFDGQPLPEPGQHQAAIITGSWAMVTDLHPWSEATAAWVRLAVAQRMPLLGVCYGHQLIAHALGGTVDYHPEGREMGCLDIHQLPTGDADPWLAGCPKRFKAHLTHLQSIVRLPQGAKALACSAHDQHQIVRYNATTVSVQFHPEFTPEIQKACIEAREDVLRGEGFDPQLMLRNLESTPVPQTLLQRFIETHVH